MGQGMTEPLIDKHLRACRALGLAEDTTIKSREELLRRMDRELPFGLEEANKEEIQAWLGKIGWTTKTRETYWCHIVAFFQWATEGRRPEMDFNPTEEIKRPRPGHHLPRVAKDAQLERALSSLDQPALLAVKLAAGVGMRAGEVALAERDHFAEGRVTITGKGDKMRSVPVPPDVWAEIQDRPPGRLVQNSLGVPVDSRWVTVAVSEALTAIGLPKLTLHFFRGSYATRAYRAGVPVPVIARLLGHSSIATTQRYLEVVDEDLDGAVAKMPRLPQRIEPVCARLDPTAEAA